jgi:hypothetical protein
MKILLSCIFATSLLLANETQNDNKIFDLKIIEDKKVKEYLNELQTNLPSLAETINDYFSSKYCNESYYSKKSFDVINEELKSFGATQQFGLLQAVKIINNDEYKKIISNYKYINCGLGKYKTTLLNKKDQ